MKKLLLSTLSCLLLIAANGQNKTDKGQSNAEQDEKMQQQKGILVFPAKLSFSLDRGQSASRSLTIKNRTDKRYQLAMVFMDWTRDTLGDHIYTPIGSSPQSCAAWVTFDKPVVDLAPDESTNLTVTMKVPDSAEAISEMKWTMLVVQILTEKVAPNNKARLETIINQTMGVGVHILQTPPNITNKEVKMLSFTELPVAKNTYRIACKNVGGVELLGKFSVELLSSETGAKTTLEPKIAPLFPQQSRYVDFTMPASLPKGKYTAIALIDASDDDVPIEAAQKEIIIK